MFLEKSIWRVHLSNLWCTFAQAIFVFWVYRSRWVDCFGCSMVRFVDSMPSVMRYPPSYDVLLYHNKVSVREKIYHIFQNCRNLHIMSTIKAGIYVSESDIYQPICQSIYQPIVSVSAMQPCPYFLSLYLCCVNKKYNK